jgi:ribonuclease T2
MFRITLLVICCTLSGAPAGASEKISGVFSADRACDAYKSFAKGTNPGLIKTGPGEDYEAVEVDNKDMAWVRIRVPGIGDPLRWVPGECGRIKLGTAAPGHRPSAPEPGKGALCHTKNQQDSYVLAMSWQPGFCEHVRYSGVKPECDALKAGSLVVDHLTLHGLWPNKKECGTGYDDCGGLPLELQDTTISKLSPWMPNFYYEKAFGTHEWDTHGVCQNLPADDYFLTAMGLVESVDASVAGSYIKSKIGTDMSAKDFFQKVKDAHGDDAAGRIMLLCADGKYLQEIRIALPLNFTTGTDLAKLTAGAPKFPRQTQKCSDDRIYVERSGRD